MTLPGTPALKPQPTSQNVEWILGYDFHYGLHEVDRETFARTPKPSAACTPRTRAQAARPAPAPASA